MSRLSDEVSHALQTMERFRQRFDVAITALSALEIEDTVTFRDVAAVLQPAELLLRVHRAIEETLVELGDEGRLLRLQLQELTDGVDGGSPSGGARLRRFGDRHRRTIVAGRRRHVALGAVVDRRSTRRRARWPPHSGWRPTVRARRLARGARLPAAVPAAPFSRRSSADRIVEHFGGIQKILRATLDDLEGVDGVDETQARAVKEGLARLAEASILDRYT